LTPVTLDAIEPAPVADGSTIGVRSIELPDELDRPPIVTRTGPNTVHFAEFDRWSGSLRSSARQLIAANLATLLPGDRVEVYPWTPGTSVDRQIIVEITPVRRRARRPVCAAGALAGAGPQGNTAVRLRRVDGERAVGT
jgi:uncharacterized lipoprotein YmbA